MATTMLRLSLLLMLLTTVISELCHPHDKKVLLQIKKELNNTDILRWDPNTDCCKWFEITCDPKTHRVNSFNIFAQEKLSAQIPPSLGQLTYLESLDLHKLPKLTGPIHPTIAKLTHLTFLRIDWTNISGPIPSFLGRLTNLTYLNLSFNNLTGSIPGSLSKLSNLGALFLDRNHLTGSIPPSLGSLKTNDLYLKLSHNHLSGPIPLSFGNLNLTFLELYRNNLTGDASMLFGPNKTVQSMDLSRNRLSFDLSKVEFPANLTSLDLNHNKVYGMLPQGLTALDLQNLNVSYNRLCGQIPVGGRLQKFDVYSYFHNKCLCGSPLPSCT